MGEKMPEPLEVKLSETLIRGIAQRQQPGTYHLCPVHSVAEEIKTNELHVGRDWHLAIGYKCGIEMHYIPTTYANLRVIH